MTDNDYTNQFKWQAAFNEALDACKELQAQVYQAQRERDQARKWARAWKVKAKAYKKLSQEMTERDVEKIREWIQELYGKECGE